MSLLSDMVALASGIIDSLDLKGDVIHKAWIGSDGRGGDAFADPVTLRAVIDSTKRLRSTANGQLVMTFASLTFLDPIDDTTANTGESREQPIDPRDILILPDGGTAPVVQSGGPLNPETGRGLINETILGSIVRGQ